eukprot:13416210-Alexandrium_andersonii.AAC.1
MADALKGLRLVRKKGGRAHRKRTLHHRHDDLPERPCHLAHKAEPERRRCSREALPGLQVSFFLARPLFSAHASAVPPRS